VINFALNAPAVGTNFPLNIDSANLSNSGITGLTGTAATTAFTAGSGKVGETIFKSPASNVAFGGNGVFVNITSQLFQPGIWQIYGVAVTTATVVGTLTYWGYSISSASATFTLPYFVQVPNNAGFVSTVADGYTITPSGIFNFTSATTVYLTARIGYSSAPTGFYTTTSAIVGTRIA